MVPEKLETREVLEADVPGVLEVFELHEVYEQQAVLAQAKQSGLEAPLGTVRRMFVSCSKYSDAANDVSLEVA